MINIYYVFSFTLLFMGVMSFMSSLYFMVLDFCYMIEWEIYSLNSSVVVMAVVLDWMSLIFISFVLFISSMVLLYSFDYMSGGMYQVRFVLLIILFVLSMLFMIISPNLVSVLLGWDGLGLVSYCLVIYYQNVKSYNAGMLTALSNRVGDVFILLSITWMLNFGSWNYIYYYDYFFNSYDYSMICYMVMFSAMTKSAQIPFSAWLPAAMAAPTPVSALVHSSTLVTAGVYLLIRFSPILHCGADDFLLFVGCMTMFLAGLMANCEYDLKKIIALSTLSQLGLMMGILAMGYPIMSFFHLLTHALFKALIFLCAGCYIHGFLDQQDIRYMGSLTILMPYSSVCFNVANLSLCGFPFLAGFYSKDVILEMCSLSNLNILIYLMFYVSAGLTVMYSVRLFYYSLISSLNFMSLRDMNNTGSNMYLSMFFLLVLSVVGGSFLSWLIFPVPSLIYLPLNLKLMTLFFLLLGFYLGYLFNSLGFFVYYTVSLFNLKNFLGQMCYMPMISTKFMSYPVFNLGGVYFAIMDHGWFEYYGSQGVYMFMMRFIKQYLYLFDYNFKTYLLFFFTLVVIMFMM